MPRVLVSLLTSLALAVPAAAQGFAMGSYGAPCTGKTAPKTCAILDANGLRIFLHGGGPRQMSMLVFGTQRAQVPLGGSCQLLLRPALVVPVQTGSTGRVDWQLPSPMKPKPDWRGMEFCFQHVVADPRGKALGGGYVTTNGFSVKFF